MSAQGSYEKVTLDRDSCPNKSGLNHEGWSTPRDVVHTTVVIQFIDHLKDLGFSRDFDVRGSCASISTDSLFDG